MLKKIKLIKNITTCYLRNEPYKLNFAITNFCNSRCVTCNTWEKYKNDGHSAKNELDESEIDRLFRNLPKSITWLSLTGGEPFLKKGIVSIVASAISHLPNLSFINIPTNGLFGRLSDTVKSILELPHRPFLYITFSIDGPPAVHNKIRRIENAFQRVWDSYETVLSLKNRHKEFDVGIEVTVSKFNVEEIYPFLREQILKHSIMINIAHNASLYKNTDEDSLIPTVHTQALSQILNLLLSRRKWFDMQNVIKRLYLKKVLEYAANPRRMVRKCFAIESSFTINPYGDVLPCLMWDKVIGNIREVDYNVESILKSKEALTVRNAINNGNCPNCWTPCEATQTIINGLLSLLFLRKPRPISRALSYVKGKARE